MTTYYKDYVDLLLDADLIYYPEEAATVAHAERWLHPADVLDDDGNPIDVEIVLDAREISATLHCPVTVIRCTGEILVDWPN